MPASWKPTLAKLQPPVFPTRTLDRPRLATSLKDALQRRVTLVAADAGFGKTTLVGRFLSGVGMSAAWYRLDPTDSDPAIFGMYLLEAARPYLPRDAHNSARRHLNLLVDWTAVASLFTSLLQRLRRDVVIVLDDFHLLAGATLRAGMERLIEDLPGRAHLALLTRVRPDLPWARWGAHGLASELGAEDLRFTAAELRALLVDLYGLPLTDAALHVVGARTEGWPAGVVLALHAALSQGPNAAAQALASVSGSTREIYNYLAQEAFDRQPPEVQRFLLTTSVLSRFTADMAQALLESVGTRATLDHLERSHLFIVPLDHERRWYRYHHLFQEFLQRVASERDPGMQRAVHRRAARLWEEDGELLEALPHLVEAGDHAGVARLLAASGTELVARGSFETVRRWMGVIPNDAWDASPRLFLIEGLCRLALGGGRTAFPLLEEAWRRLRACGDIEGEANALHWLAYAATWEGEVDRIRAALADVVPDLGRQPPAARARTLEAIARVHHASGNLQEAESVFAEALEFARSSGDESAYLWCARNFALLLQDAGRFEDARRLQQDALATCRRRGWTHDEAHLHVDLAVTLSLVGADEEAEQHLVMVGGIAAAVPCRVLRADLLIAAGQLAARRGDREAAGRRLQEALGPGGAMYAFDRVRAQMALGLLLASTEPAEAQRLALRTVEAGARLGPIVHGRALLILGTVTRSAEPCLEAAAIFGRVGAAHLEALACLRAADLAADEGGAIRARARTLLRSLSDQAWEFVAAQAGPAALSHYAEDAALATRIARLPALGAADSRRLVLRCLGPFELWRGGTPEPTERWQRSAPRRLLQYLALQTRPVHREEIAEALWPGLTPDHAANQLRVALSQLRRILEPDRPARGPSWVLVTRGATVWLARQRLEIDVERFMAALARAETPAPESRYAALADAVGLYGGDLCADSPYEEWLAPHRARLLRRFLGALSALAEHDEASGRWEAALSRWQAVLDGDPDAEHAYRGLIRCYLALGRASDAHRAFEACRTALADLGTVPSPETLSLRERIEAPPSP